MVALGRARQAKGRKYYDSNVNMPAFLTAKNLNSFIPKELSVTSSQIEFRTVRGHKAFGYAAELLPKACDVFIDADEANVLTAGQKHIAVRARVLVRGLAHVGIKALVDEATGYQEIRDRQALQEMLDKYLLAERAKWAKRFPDEFYKEIFRLRDWHWKGMQVNRPQVVGRYTNDIVWDRLAPGVRKELERLNPKTETGERRSRHHQWLTYDIGHPELQKHLNGVIVLMKSVIQAKGGWEEFRRRLQRVFPKINTNLDLPFDEG